MHLQVIYLVPNMEKPGRITREQAVVVPPEEWLMLTTEFRDLLVAINIRGVQPGDDDIVKNALAAVPHLVNMIDNECVTYVMASMDEIKTLEKRLDEKQALLDEINALEKQQRRA